MPEPNEVYEPSGELVNLRADQFGREQDKRIKVGGNARQSGMPYDVADLPEEIGGIRVERPVKTEHVLKGFFRSQIEDPDFYQEHKSEILEAQRNNLIVDDKTDPKHAAMQKHQQEEFEVAMRKSDERIALPYLVRESEKAADEAYEAYRAAQDEHDAEHARTGISDDPRVRMARFEVVKERKAAWDAALAKRNELKKKLTDVRLGRKPVEA